MNTFSLLATVYFVAFIVGLIILPIWIIFRFKKTSSWKKFASILVFANNFYYIYCVYDLFMYGEGEMPGLGYVLLPILWAGSSLLFFLIGLTYGKIVEFLNGKMGISRFVLYAIPIIILIFIVIFLILASELF